MASCYLPNLYDGMSFMSLHGARWDFSSALCIAHGGVPSCAHRHTQTPARTPTHTDTCAHTQVSTLSVSAAADAELEVAEQLPTSYGHYQCLKCTGSYKADRK